jgi:hypothetical protein
MIPPWQLVNHAIDAVYVWASYRGISIDSRATLNHWGEYEFSFRSVEDELRYGEELLFFIFTNLRANNPVLMGSTKDRDALTDVDAGEIFYEIGGSQFYCYDGSHWIPLI